VQTTKTVKRFTKTIILNVDENIVRRINKKLLSADLYNNISKSDGLSDSKDGSKLKSLSRDITASMRHMNDGVHTSWNCVQPNL